MSAVVIIGGGHNGLAAAFYLAKAGLRPIVLERRDRVGGGAITSELHPGFRCPTLTHHTSLWTSIVADMDLRRHGVDFITPPVRLFAPQPDGPALVLYDDAQRTADAMRASHPRDAVAYPRYRAAIERVSSVAGSLLTAPPPHIDRPTAGDVWRLLRTGRAFKALGRQGGYRLLRWAPMPVADLVREWFESETLCASIAAPALSGTMMGPRSAGSGLVLLMHEANRLLASGVSRVRGGPGALTQAMAAAARGAGAEIRTGSAVERIVVRSGKVAGVVAGGAELEAATVVSAIDPKTTYLRLVDPIDLTPDFMAKIRNYRASGTISKINLALSTLPDFGVPTDVLSGRIHIGATLDYLEQAFDHAKYGEPSQRPWLEVTIPSILDPDLAPTGGHVMSIYVHYTPYRLRKGDWATTKDTILDRALAALEPHAPGIRNLVLAAEVITPAELEAEFGFWGGHPFHGELALDQLFTMRPLLGYGRYSSPIAGLHLCGGGTHPGGFLNGASGKLAAQELASR